MEPVSLIMSALAAGAVAGVQNTAGEAVKDAYRGLKAAVERIFRGRSSGQAALERHEENPDAWAGALEAELVEVDAGQHADLIRAAQQLLALVDEVGARSGKYQVDLRGGRGVQVGDGNTMTNTFTTPSAR
jgi:hypothetical protein